MRNWKTIWVLAFGAATLLGFSAAIVAYFGRIAASRPFSLGSALLATLPDWYFWALVAPLVLWLSRRFRFEKRRWLSRSAIHLMAGMVVALAEVAFFTMFYQHLGDVKGFSTYLQYYFYTVAHWFHYQFLVYWLIVTASHAFDYYRHYQERKLVAARLEAQLSGAQLQALRMQLHPHFLFNTLHTISVFMRERKTDAAIDMIAVLGDLLRQSLDRVGTQEVLLKDEIKFLQDYLKIEQIRFGDQLKVRIDIPSEILGAWVPNMILQPLVENAIRHGIAPKLSAGLIEIDSRVSDGMLQIRIRDNGPGFDKAAPSSSGTQLGLGNTQARLQHLYGSRHCLKKKNLEGGGAEVVLQFPLHTEPMETQQGGSHPCQRLGFSG